MLNIQILYILTFFTHSFCSTNIQYCFICPGQTHYKHNDPMYSLYYLHEILSSMAFIITINTSFHKKQSEN